MKKINWTPKQEAEINRVQRTTGVTRKSAIRKMRAAAKVQAKGKAQAVKTTPKPQPQQKSAGVNRSEGIRLFKVAGRPTKEQFILVYGERGPAMTWDQRAAAGVPAEQFQAALAAKVRGERDHAAIRLRPPESRKFRRPDRRQCR